MKPVKEGLRIPHGRGGSEPPAITIKLRERPKANSTKQE